MAKQDPTFTSSIKCFELSCNQLAAWKITYQLDEKRIVGYACDCHIGDNCNPVEENTVSSICIQVKN